MKRLLKLLFLLFLYATPALAERGVFISSSATCSDVPNPEAIFTYCLPATGGNVHNLLYWDGAGWSIAIPGSGTGSVTSFSAGTLSPLFTTSVSNATTTPALSFTLSNFGAHAFLGNATGGSAAPTAVQPSFSDLAGTATAGQLPATVVLNNQTNTYTGTVTQDFSGATTTVKLPLKSTAPTAGEIIVNAVELQWRDNAGPTLQTALRASDATIVKTNQANTFTAGPQKFSNTVEFNVNTPAQITGNQNDYSPGTTGYLRLSSNATWTITGISGGGNYRVLYLKNINTVGNLILAHQNAASSAANRIISQTGTDMTVQPGDMVLLLYDNTDSRWTASKVGISPTTQCAAGSAPTGINSSANSIACVNFMEEPTAAGIVVKIGNDQSAGRQVTTATTNRIVITNPDMINGNAVVDVGPNTIDGSLYGCSPVTASGTAYACNLTLAPGGYVLHGIYHFKADVASGAGPVTINFNSLGAKTIKKAVSTDLAANDILAGQEVLLFYDGANMQLISGAGGSGGSVCGSNKYVQFNDAGSCGAVTGFQFDKATNIATLSGGAVLGAGPYLINDYTAIATSDKTATWRNLSGTVAYLADINNNNIRPCEIVIGDPGAASAPLANDNDSPSVCGNKYGATLTITAVECFADAGSPTVTPIITGGGATSILSGALTCGTGSFASGTLNGTPTQTNGQSIDGNLTTAGGTAKYIVMRITRTL